jgi:hypothetical protein
MPQKSRYFQNSNGHVSQLDVSMWPTKIWSQYADPCQRSFWPFEVIKKNHRFLRLETVY